MAFYTWKLKGLFTRSIVGYLFQYGPGQFTFRQIPENMPNTFTQLHNHVVFATKYREGFIHQAWQEELHKYITGIVQKYEHKMLQVNSMPDHVHMLIGMRPDQSLSSLIQTTKSESAKWIKQQHRCSGFAWQAGFGAFSHSRDQLPGVMLYIEHQKEHHREVGFREEYIRILNESGVEFDEKYIFHDPL
jgi:putative transposase